MKYEIENGCQKIKNKFPYLITKETKVIYLLYYFLNIIFKYFCSSALHYNYNFQTNPDKVIGKR